MEIDTITLGDCLDVLPTLPSASIDLVLCDLPYQKTSARWDTIIPVEALWAQYKRLLKPRGAILLTAQQPFSAYLIASQPRWYRHCWVWDKGYGIGINAKYAPIPHHEDILVFGRKGVAYYPIKTPLPRPQHSTRSSKSVLFHDHAPITDTWYTDRYPTTILRIPQDRQDHIHPTQKPVALFDYLIRSYSQPGQVVLDHCSGSATTAVAAYRADRRFICIEKDPVYFQKSQERLARERARPCALTFPDTFTAAE